MRFRVHALDTSAVPAGGPPRATRDASQEWSLPRGIRFFARCVQMNPGDGARGRMVWYRMRVPLVAGERTSGFQLAAAMADFAYGTPMVLRARSEPGFLPDRDFTQINPDTTLNLLREPQGEWIGLESAARARRSRCRSGRGDGVGRPRRGRSRDPVRTGAPRHRHRRASAGARCARAGRGRLRRKPFTGAQRAEGARRMGTMDRTFDPLDASNGIPYEGLARLRAESPVYRTPGGAWYISQQADVVRAAEEVHTFVANFREPGVVVPEQEKLVSEIAEPRHGSVRKIVNSAIAYHKLGRVGPMVRDMAEELVDALVERGGGNAVRDLILPIPNAAIGFLLGVPPGDFALWAQWSDDVVYSEYPARNRTARGVGLAGAFPEFSAYIDRQIAERRSALSPPEDFVTRLIQTEVDGRRLEDVELRTLIAFLLVSGNETTRHLLGNLMTTFAQRPDLWRELRADPSLISAAVEESLRVDPPVAVLMRNCAHDTEIRGVKIRAGEKVAFGVASANRDASCYEAPDEFRLDRANPKAHVAFGGGPHVCPGAALARLEGRILLEVLLERVSELRVAPDFKRQKVAPFWANGPSSLPLEVVAR